MEKLRQNASVCFQTTESPSCLSVLLQLYFASLPVIYALLLTHASFAFFPSSYRRIGFLFSFFLRFVWVILRGGGGAVGVVEVRCPNMHPLREQSLCFSSPPLSRQLPRPPSLSLHPTPSPPPPPPSLSPQPLFWYGLKAWDAFSSFVCLVAWFLLFFLRKCLWLACGEYLRRKTASVDTFLTAAAKLSDSVVILFSFSLQMNTVCGFIKGLYSQWRQVAKGDARSSHCCLCI